MKTPLIPVSIISIYRNSLGDPVPLPARLAICTPDTYSAIMGISRELSAKGGKLILSDLYRSYDMQMQSHQDYISGKKKAFSPPPGGSFHEAGRAFDLDLGSLKITLSEFWGIAKKYGVKPIISQPKSSLSEAWHFDCRGSHQLVEDYYAAGKGSNFKPYTAAAASAILSAGIRVDAFGSNQKQAAIQSGLIRLGKEIGNIDGQIGKRTHQALDLLGIPFDPDHPDPMLIQVENMLQMKFPAEYTSPAVLQGTPDS
jgi:hypothetical protein